MLPGVDAHGDMITVVRIYFEFYLKKNIFSVGFYGNATPAKHRHNQRVGSGINTKSGREQVEDELCPGRPPIWGLERSLFREHKKGGNGGDNNDDDCNADETDADVKWVKPGSYLLYKQRRRCLCHSRLWLFYVSFGYSVMNNYVTLKQRDILLCNECVYFRVLANDTTVNYCKLYFRHHS
uniref:Uncharacterized protein n=1 Tax=Glossina pallidipes TaxID=7398 RepID=A0A1A9Z463_GLOPL